ncbi:MAG: HisA/HisF-related TIM barrel protein [bacterium]
MPVIASGSVSTKEDINKLRTIPGVDGCIVGKAIYEGLLKLADVL